MFQNKQKVHMIHTRKLTAAIAALLTLAALPSRADHTNLVQTIHIQFSGVSQGAGLMRRTLPLGG